MRLFHHSIILLLAIVFNQHAQASETQDTIVLFGTFDVTSNRTLVIQPPNVDPNTLPIPQDGNKEYIPTTKKAETAVKDRHKIRNGLLIGLLTPFAITLVVIVFLVVKTVKIRRKKLIPFPSWKIILSPTGRWPTKDDSSGQRPRIEHLRIPVRRRDAPVKTTRKDARQPREHQPTPAELEASTFSTNTEVLDQFLNDVGAEPFSEHKSKPVTKIKPDPVSARAPEMEFMPRPGAAELYGSFPKTGNGIPTTKSPFITTTTTSKEPNRK